MYLKSAVFGILSSLGLVFALACSAAPAYAADLPAGPARVTRWICDAFYLPARSIWQRTVDVESDISGVRAVQVDGVPVYSFNIEGKTILTAVDGERIQLDTDTQTWTSDLRGLASAQGRCER